MFDTKTKRYDPPNAHHLAYLAALVAVEAPVRQNKHSSTAKIEWPLVDQIRAALDEAGFDWRTAAAKHKELRSEEYAQRVHARYNKPAGEVTQ